MERTKINGPLTWSLLFMAGALVLVVITLPPLVRAVFAGGDGGSEADQRFAQLLTEHEESLESYTDRFNGRSVFFEPPARRRATPPPQPRKPRDSGPRVVTPAPPAPKATRPPYSGPAIKGFAGGQVWFAGDLRVRKGEVRDGIEVVEINAPWSVKLLYGGWEYDRPLFDRDDSLFAASGSASAGVGSRVMGLEVLPPTTVAKELEELEDISEPVTATSQPERAALDDEDGRVKDDKEPELKVEQPGPSSASSADGGHGA